MYTAKAQCMTPSGPGGVSADPSGILFAHLLHVLQTVAILSNEAVTIAAEKNRLEAVSII